MDMDEIKKMPLEKFKKLRPSMPVFDCTLYVSKNEIYLKQNEKKRKVSVFVPKITDNPHCIFSKDREIPAGTYPLRIVSKGTRILGEIKHGEFDELLVVIEYR